MKNGMKLVVGSMVAAAAVVFGAWCFSGEGYQKAEAEEVGPEYSTAMPCESVKNPMYSVNGSALDPVLQDYIYRIMLDEGCAWAFPYWLCEIYQESGYQPYVTDGESYGFCQLNATYYYWYLMEYDLPADTDLTTDYYANLYVGTNLFCDKLKQNDLSLEHAIMDYFNSGDSASEYKYYEDVKQWFNTLQKI